MDERSFGLVVIALGLVAVMVGLLIFAGGLGWFGRLPGDIAIKKDSVRVYFPIVSMLLVSVVLAVLLTVIRRLF